MPTLIVECPYCQQPTPQFTDLDSVLLGTGTCNHCHEDFVIVDNAAVLHAVAADSALVRSLN